MASLDLILESIREKAEEEKNQILDKANKEKEEIEKDHKEKADKEVEKILNDAKKDSNLLLDNERLSASRKARDIKISGKNDLIDKILDKLLDKLKNMDEESYKKFVENRLKDFPKKDAEILLQEGMDSVYSVGGLKVSSETVEDGFLIRDDKVIYDNSFSSIIDYEKDELKKEISDFLSKENI